MKENGFSDSSSVHETIPPAKRHQTNPTIGSRLSPAALTPLLLHGRFHHPTVLPSHLATSARSIFEEANNPSVLYHNSPNSRENPINGRSHSAEHLSDRYATVNERLERDYNRSLYAGLPKDYIDERDTDEEWKNIHTVSSEQLTWRF